MFFAWAIALTLVILAFTLFVRGKDVPVTPPVPAWMHLEGRKAAIYENLRDVIFEYRVGKLSDQDYDRTKKELQAELSKVLAEIDVMKSAAAPAGSKPAKAVDAKPADAKPAKAADAKPADTTICPHCGAKFDKPLRFCGECGKPMGGTA